MSCVFFVPVFNQVRELPQVLAEFAAAAVPGVELLLVNNGSSDGSEKLVRDSGHPFIDLPRNRGIGYAYRLGLERALERDDVELFGTMAANAKMLPAEMPRLLEPLRAGRADYVTGSRFLAGGASPNLPGFRRRTIPLVNLFVLALTGQRLTDATCGYRAFRFEMVSRATFDLRAPWLETYGFEYYLYAKALLDPEIRALEVPMTMRYPERGPYSKIRPFRDWYAMLKPWLIARLDGRGFRPRERS